MPNNITWMLRVVIVAVAVISIGCMSLRTTPLTAERNDADLQQLLNQIPERGVATFTYYKWIKCEAAWNDHCGGYAAPMKLPEGYQVCTVEFQVSEACTRISPFHPKLNHQRPS